MRGYPCISNRRHWIFKIISEGSVSSGVRRIEAVCGKAAEEYVNVLERTIRETSEVLKVPHHKIPDKVKQLNDDLMQRAKKLGYSNLSK